MAAERINDIGNSDSILAGREFLAGWVSGDAPKRGILIEFPINPPVDAKALDRDQFEMGDHWERIKEPVETADDLRFDILVQQEGIDANENAHDRIAHERMLSPNGVHVRRNRYASGFPSWDDTES